MPLSAIKLRPVLGIKNDVPINDPSMFVGEASYSPDMDNMDMGRRRGSASKAVGRSQFTAGANSQATTIQGLYELINSSGAVDHIVFDKGKVFYVASDRTQTEIAASSAKTWGTTGAALISAIQYGNYIIWTDRLRTEVPYKWSNGDANSTALLLAGTAFKFSYLEKFQRRIIGAYSDQTNGDIEIRWTDALPAWASCSMPAANQQYKPGNDSITGIKTFGNNACFLYGSESIDSIDYYANYTVPFAIRNMVTNHGCTGHHSIVDTGTTHYLFNRHYGFCAYKGGSEFPAGGRPISDPIDAIIAGINPLYYHLIVGTFIPHTSEICWSIPANGASVNNTLLFYDIIRGIWSKRTHTASYLSYWTLDSGITWNDLAALGYTTWNDFGTLRWADLVGATPYLMSGNTNGHVYSHSSESDVTASMDGYRTEPAVGVEKKTLLLEIVFHLSAVGNYSLYVHYRGGDTIGECEGNSWEVLGEVSCNSPNIAILYTNRLNNWHQIKYGTDAASEPFSVNEVELKFAPQGVY